MNSTTKKAKSESSKSKARKVAVNEAIYIESYDQWEGIERQIINKKYLEAVANSLEDDATLNNKTVEPLNLHIPVTTKFPLNPPPESAGPTDPPTDHLTKKD